MQPKDAPPRLLAALVRAGDADAVAYVARMLASSGARSKAAHKLGISLRTLERLREDVPALAEVRTARSKRLTHELAEEIRKASPDATREELAERFDVSLRTVSRARAGFPRKADGTRSKPAKPSRPKRR